MSAKYKYQYILILFILALVLIVPILASCGDDDKTSPTTTPTPTATPTPQATTASFDKTKLDEYLRQLEENNKAMCGVVISKDGQVVYENYIGFASVKNGIKNNNLTKFRIGSITKMFTATMIFQLIEEGKLTLDTKLFKFYPQIQNSEEITISDMLSMRSGIHNFTDDKEYLQYMTTKKSKEEMLDLIANFKPDFQPNERFEYSNSNYLLLGYIIEDITDSTYQHELETRITSKLNLANTYYGHKIDTQKDEAASYRFQYEKWDLLPETDMSIPGGAGAIVSTPQDLAVFVSALFNNRLVSEDSLSQMKQMQDGYGKGLIRIPFGSTFGYGHDGAIDGFISFLVYFPDENVVLAVTDNGVNYYLNDMLIGILSIYFSKQFEIPDLTAKAIHLDTEELKKYEGVFSSKLVPIEITLTVKNGQLFGQATGQPAYPVTLMSKTELRYDPLGVVVEFAKDDQGNVQYNSFTFKQGGGQYLFERK